jgi:hypothetical protein
MASTHSAPDQLRLAPGEVARMLGPAPQVRESGDRRRSGRVLKSGNPRARTVLVEAAWRWVASDGGAGERYRELVGNTGSGKKAVVGMARRPGVLLWRLSTRNEPYRTLASCPEEPPRREDRSRFDDINPGDGRVTSQRGSARGMTADNVRRARPAS